MISVIVADDHPIVRAGIVGILEQEPDMRVVAEVNSGEEAAEAAAGLAPDVVLMDLRMPGIGGVEATRRIVDAASARVLVFTTYEDDDQILAAIEAGASGYQVKAAPPAELVAAVRAVAAGQTVLAPSIAAQLVSRAQDAARSTPPPGSNMPRLTAREHEVLRWVADGLSNPEIAARLRIGESTVKTHLLHAFEKLEVRDRTRAVTRAMELGLL